VWRGLSAQLLRNRKFAGMPQHDGAAQHWYRVGSRQSWCLLELRGGYKGSDGESFTAHFNPKNGHACQRQRVECFTEARCGIAQRGIPLVRGRKYVGRLALRADRDLAVSVRLAGKALAQGPLEASPGYWYEAAFCFTAPATTADARLEITFQGPGVLYVGMASLLPADHFHGMRRDVVELLKEIGVPILRWPGGNFAGDYRWQDGLLPVDRRAPLYSAFIETLPHTDWYDTHEIGTDEFMALCRELGAEPFITINLSLERAKEAAAWAEYCNGSPDTQWGGHRAAQGHPEPYNVRHWTLGNEMGYSHMKGPNTPREYSQLAADCARAMRAVTPDLIFTSSTGWSEQWYQGLLAAEEDYYQNISHHTYNTLMRRFEGEAGAAELRKLASCPDIIFHTRARGEGYTGETRLTMLDIRDLVDESPRRDRGIGIAFDEWNVWYAWYREPGVAEGIYAALMLGHLCREARKLGVTIGAYFEPVNEGAILVEPASARLTPVGQVHALFKAHHGNELLDVAPSAEADDLDLVASRNPRTGQITVSFVNRSPDAAREATIRVDGAPPPKSVEGVLLTSRNYRPGSVFGAARLSLRATSDGALSLTLPPRSVASVHWPTD
jgi:alpha-N-arabinofuranosidase